jgi:heme o synthase
MSVVARLEPRERPARATPGATVRAYVSLTKPRIIELLLVTTLPAMVLATRGLPSLSLVVATLGGGAAAAGSANALNCVIDRDIDAVMHRTARRPMALAEVSTRGALVFGLVLGVGSVALLWVSTNALAALLTLLAIVVYVVGYTLLLKRRTSSNIVWGGSAGCLPTLIGWTAVTGHLAWPPVVLFAIVFFWTPPHFWALAMRFRDDYAAAGVPMLPVVATPAAVVRQIGGYAAATVATSLLLWPVAGTGWLYPTAATILGGYLLREVMLLHRDVAASRPARPMRLFHASIAYLAVLFLVIAVDVLLVGRAGPDAGTLVGSWRESGVQVQVRWLPDSGALEATFTPLEPGFHLYGTQLADDGVDGVGRPTRLAVAGALTQAAPAQALSDAPLTRLSGLPTAVPLYPAGPVTLRLPVRRARTAAGGVEAPAWAQVSYAACNDLACLPPVTGRQLVLSLPPAP